MKKVLKTILFVSLMVGLAVAVQAETFKVLSGFPTTHLYTEALRICWENPTRNYNCGRCHNCIRTNDPMTTVKRWGSGRTATDYWCYI